VQNRAIVGNGQFAGYRVVLAKPQTYMNLSGEAIAPLVRFYKVPAAHLMLIHDDLDLPFGTLRLRPGGGSGGQKGVASTISRLGTQDFPRMRAGIGRPPGQMNPSDYVLYPFRPAEQETLQYLLDHAVAAVKTFIQEGLDQAMNQFNGTVGG
jgi:PTH1 family peptidyl-tRNA hydrolase